MLHVSNEFDSRQVVLDAGGPIESTFEHPDDLGLQPFLCFLYYRLRDPLLATAVPVAVPVPTDAAFMHELVRPHLRHV